MLTRYFKKDMERIQKRACQRYQGLSTCKWKNQRQADSFSHTKFFLNKYIKLFFKFLLC